MSQEKSEDKMEIWLDIIGVDNPPRQAKAFYNEGVLFVECNREDNTWREIAINDSKTDEEFLIIKANGGRVIYCNLDGVAFKSELVIY